MVVHFPIQIMLNCWPKTHPWQTLQRCFRRSLQWNHNIHLSSSEVQTNWVVTSLIYFFTFVHKYTCFADSTMHIFFDKCERHELVRWTYLCFFSCQLSQAMFPYQSSTLFHFVHHHPECASCSHLWDYTQSSFQVDLHNPVALPADGTKPLVKAWKSREQN